MNKLQWVPLKKQRTRNKVSIVFIAMDGKALLPLNDFKVIVYNTRSGNKNVSLPQSSVKSHLYSLLLSTLILWSKLPTHMKHGKDT